MKTVAIDMMGGDYAPLKAIVGIQQYLEKQVNDVFLLLIGKEEILSDMVASAGLQQDRIRIIDAREVIEMHEHPTKALKEKQGSSIAVGFHLLSTAKADAFISAGNTGAMMVGSLFSIGAIPGVARPTIGAYIPREDGSLGLLLDVGLNADCKPENLNQFAILGSLFAKHVLGITEPRVGLVNIGEEEGKGNILAQAAYPLLKANPGINFAGNIEGRDILLNKADIMVCEGFVGNVVLKLAESIHDIVTRRNIQDEHFSRFNFEAYGGVPVLGVAKPVIIGHGISGATAFENMINVAVKMLESGLMDKTKEAFA